jgi:hypothetical protein
LAERTSQLSATVREAVGLIEVTVGSNGQVTNLGLDEKIATAKVALVRRHGEITAETVGADSTTGRAVFAGLNARLGVGEDEPQS